MRDDIKTTVEAVRAIPAFDVSVGRHNQYESIGHCVLDSIFSIGVRYEGVKVVLRRYCEHYQLAEFHHGDGTHPLVAQLRLSGLVAQIREVGSERFAA